MSEMLNLCGLWTNKDKNGNTYYSGKLTYSTRVMVFKNKNKSTSKDPDLHIVLCKNEKKEESSEKKQDLDNDLPF